MELITLNSNGNEQDFTEEDPLRGKEQGTEKNTTFGEKIAYAFKNVTVEPCFILFMTPMMITMLTSQNLALQKACHVNLQFSDEICELLKNQSLDSQNQYERETQRLVSTTMAIKTYMTATIPCLFALFSGAYSDKVGHRKVFICFPIIGQFLGCINSIINVFFFKVTNLETFLYVEAAIEALSGGICVMCTILYAFVCAITTDDSRTFRLGIVSFSMSAGVPIGLALSGVLLSYSGYYGAYGVAAGFHLVNLTYTIFVLKDPPRTAEQKQV